MYNTLQPGLPSQFRSNNSQIKSNQLCRDFQTAFAMSRGKNGGGAALITQHVFRACLAIELNQMQSRRDAIEIEIDCCCCFWSAVRIECN